MNKLSNLMIILILFALNSCNENADPAIEIIDERTEFIEGKSNAQQKEEYRDLPFSKKRNLWSSKLSQLERTNLPSKHLKLISSMKGLIGQLTSENDLANNSEFQAIGIALSEITPKEDFIQMFVRLDDYEISKTTKFKNSSLKVTEKLKQAFLDRRTVLESSNRINKQSPDCNCDWTCGDGLCDTNYNCDATDDGCGFFFLFSCDGFDSLDC